MIEKRRLAGLFFFMTGQNIVSVALKKHVFRPLF